MSIDHWYKVLQEKIRKNFHFSLWKRNFFKWKNVGLRKWKWMKKKFFIKIAFSEAFAFQELEEVKVVFHHLLKFIVLFSFFCCHSVEILKNQRKTFLIIVIALIYRKIRLNSFCVISIYCLDWLFVVGYVMSCPCVYLLVCTITVSQLFLLKFEL